ncbi:hypothetical protein KJ359_009752 [Pestalotiopsis sp. 9143b]|nr:hypothetical protein KJ359_009752 [Pestalotiopsis sp. 9143b]
MSTSPHTAAEIISEITVPASTATPSPGSALRKPKSDIFVRMAPPAAAENAALVERLRGVVNLVYGETEGDIFVDGYQRVGTQEMVDIVRAGQLAVAYLASSPRGEEAVGCMRIKTLSDGKTGELGMFAVDPAYRGGGLGRDMVAFAESHCRGALGLETMRLELLVPRGGVEHAFKKRLQAWYERMGYAMVKLGVFQDDYPQLAPLLRGACEYRVYEKSLL